MSGPWPWYLLPTRVGVGGCKDCKISQGMWTCVNSTRIISPIPTINNYNDQNCFVKLKVNITCLYIIRLLGIKKKKGNLSFIYHVLSILHGPLLVVIEYTCTIENIYMH